MSVKIVGLFNSIAGEDPVEENDLPLLLPDTITLNEESVVLNLEIVSDMNFCGEIAISSDSIFKAV